MDYFPGFIRSDENETERPFQIGGSRALQVPVAYAKGVVGTEVEDSQIGKCQVSHRFLVIAVFVLIALAQSLVAPDFLAT